MSSLIEMTDWDAEGVRSFVADFRKPDGTTEEWTIDVFREGDTRVVEFHRNGVSMGGGVVGYKTVDQGPSGQKGPAPEGSL